MKESKTCFVIMPISNNSNYLEGHFDRVYDYIIKPACEIAGFSPIRADEVVTTNYIALDIIKKIIESDMAICDLSSQNANVMYELGIRQAFNKPVTFIKDSITNRVFDIQGFRDFEYDVTLRIDNVNTVKELLSEAITQTYNNKDSEINSLVKLLSIAPAELSEKTNLSVESELILNQLNIITSRLDKIERNDLSHNYEINHILPQTMVKIPVPENSKILTFEETLRLLPKNIVFHERFGYGEVVNVIIGRDLKDSKIDIKFNNSGVKKLLLKFASLYIVL